MLYLADEYLTVLFFEEGNLKNCIYGFANTAAGSLGFERFRLEVRGLASRVESIEP